MEAAPSPRGATDGGRETPPTHTNANRTKCRRTEPHPHIAGQVVDGADRRPAAGVGRGARAAGHGPARPATQLAYTAPVAALRGAAASLDEQDGRRRRPDPGFSSVFNVKWLREAEILHRICMLAWTGFVATDLGFTLPGDMHQVSSVEAHDVACKYGAMQQIFLWISFVEVVHSFGVAQMMWMGSDRQPGDFGLDPLDFCSTPEKAADMKLKEITHCRLAMFAFSGVVTQAVLTGKGFPYF